MSLDGRTTRFRAERESIWRELEKLLGRAEAEGLRSLSAQEALRLPQLYRATLSALAVARSTSLDRNLLEYLEALSARAFLIVHGAKRGLLETLWEFFRRGFPRAFRASLGLQALSALLFVGGVLIAAYAVERDSENFYSFVSEEMAQGRDPRATRAELREPLYHGGTVESEELATFSGFLFNNNARIGIAAFALGFLAGLPTFVLLLVNGLTLGAMHAIYAQQGLGRELWAWLLPHGVTELLAIVVCGGAGLLVGRALVLPGQLERRESLLVRGRRAAALAGGAVAMFLIAAGIEGFFRQRVQDETMRWLVAASTAVFWTWYFGWVGREEREERAAPA